MASQNAFASLLVAAGLLLLAIVNQLGWLLLLVPVALLVARSLAGNGQPPKHHGARI
jgi:hypothetical protein